MKNRLIYTFLLTMLMFSASSLFAENKTQDAGSIQMEFDEHVDDTALSRDITDDYFTAGRTVKFSGSADDVYLFGKTINHDGTTKGNMMAIGETVEIAGVVEGNLHSAGESVNITGILNETAFITGDRIVIAKDAMIAGTLISASRTLHIMGGLNNGLLAGGGEIIIDSPINGDVKVQTGKLIITERGSIEGNLVYGSNTELSEKEKERISGTIEYEVRTEHIEKEDFTKFLYMIKGFFLFALIISGILLLLFPGIKSLFNREMEKGNYGKTLLWGLIPLFIFPVLIIVTIPILPLSVTLGFSVLPLLGLTQIFGLVLIGQFLFKTFNWTKNNVFLHYLFAALLFAVLLMVPVLNVIVSLTVSAMGAGLVIGKLFQTEF